MKFLNVSLPAPVMHERFIIRSGSSMFEGRIHVFVSVVTQAMQKLYLLNLGVIGDLHLHLLTFTFTCIVDCCQCTCKM